MSSLLSIRPNLTMAMIEDYKEEVSWGDTKKKCSCLQEHICYVEKNSNNQTYTKLAIENLSLKKENLEQNHLLVEYSAMIFREICAKLLHEIKKNPDLENKLRKNLDLSHGLDGKDIDDLGAMLAAEKKPAGFDEEFSDFVWVVPSRGDLLSVLDDLQKAIYFLSKSGAFEDPLASAHQMIKRNTSDEEKINRKQAPNKLWQYGSTAFSAGKTIFRLYEEAQKIALIASILILAKNIPWLRLARILAKVILA